jgi:hypothetical protein
MSTLITAVAYTVLFGMFPGGIRNFRFWEFDVIVAIIAIIWAIASQRPYKKLKIYNAPALFLGENV